MNYIYEHKYINMLLIHIIKLKLCFVNKILVKDQKETNTESTDSFLRVVDYNYFLFTLLSNLE